MMAASLKDADELVDLLLARDADVNMKSVFISLARILAGSTLLIFNDRQQWSGKSSSSAPSLMPKTYDVG